MDGTHVIECIWCGHCEYEVCPRCEHFSPADESEYNENYYYKVLKENVETYDVWFGGDED